MREKYEAALGEISDAIEEYCLVVNKEMYSKLEKAQDTIMQLIENHFDNPPLKFEELEVGKVYWDKKYNQWCLMIMVCKYPHTKYFDGTISDAKFEEDRFYRKQVE